MATIGHPIKNPIAAAIAYGVGTPPYSGDHVVPMFSALGPGSNNEITTAPRKGTGSATYTRADGTTDITHIRDFENLYKRVPQNEARFQGARRVTNKFFYSNDFSQSNWVKTNVTPAQQSDGSWLCAPSSNNALMYQSMSTSLHFDTYVFSGEIKAVTSDISDFDIFINGTGANPNPQDTPFVVSASEWRRFSITLTTTPGSSFNVGFGLDNSWDTGDDVYIKNLMLEGVDGQTNQAPSEYIPTTSAAVTKYYYTKNLNEVAENRIVYSNDLRGYSNTATVSYDSDLDESTLTDDSLVAQLVRSTTGTVPDDSNNNTASIYVKKTTSNPNSTLLGFFFQYYGGTGVNTLAQLNPLTGKASLNTYTDGTFKVEDKGDYWKLILTQANNSSGNTTWSVTIYPALSDLYGGIGATGTITVKNVQVAFNTDTATETQVKTDGTVITNVVGTKTGEWEQVDNRIAYSYDLTQWTQTGTSVSALDAVGIDGVANHATTLTDDNAAAYEYVSANTAISNDSNTHVLSVIMNKDPGATANVALDLNVYGGTQQRGLIHFSLADGTSAAQISTGTVTFWSEDLGTEWRFVVTVANNSTGNVTLGVGIYPAVGTSLGTATTAAIGSCVVKHVQVSFNRQIPFSRNVTTTTGSAITLGKDVGLGSYNLQPIGTKYGATYFKRFAKWAASTAYSVGDIIIPATGSGTAGGNGYYYQCVVAGTSAGSEPSFGTTIGDGTYDNGVVWKCVGLATVAGYFAEPSRTNSITYSYDLTAWTQVGTAVSALDAVGIDGVDNHATTLTDDDGATTESVNTTVTIANDGNTHVAQWFVKKDSDTSRFPRFVLQFTGGTSVYGAYHLNTLTGATTSTGNNGTVVHWVEDHGLWWRVVIAVTNNTTGNTTALFDTFPASGTVFGTPSNAATGSIIVGHAQLELNTSVPSSPILTTGAADTRAADAVSYNLTNIPNDTASIVISYGELSVDAGSESGQSQIIGSRSGYPGHIYRSGTSQIGAYDETNLETLSSALTATKENPTIDRLGMRSNAVTLKQEVFANGTGSTEGTFDGAYAQTASALVIANSGDIPVVISDVVIYNKDLGSTKLASMTAYD